MGPSPEAGFASISGAKRQFFLEPKLDPESGPEPFTPPPPAPQAQGVCGWVGADPLILAILGLPQGP